MNSQVTSVKKKIDSTRTSKAKDAGTRRPELPHALEKTYMYNMVCILRMVLVVQNHRSSHHQR